MCCKIILPSSFPAASQNVMIKGINRCQLVLGYPAGKQECPLFLNEK
jgi:hypothetical protein